MGEWQGPPIKRQTLGGPGSFVIVRPSRALTDTHSQAFPVADG